MISKMSLESAINLPDSEIPLKSEIRGLRGARIYSGIQNPGRCKEFKTAFV